MRIQAYTDIGLLPDHGRDSGRMAVARIGQHQFAGLKAKTPKPLGSIRAAGRGEIETVALQRRQAQTVVNAPLASRLPRLFYHRRIKQTYRSSMKGGLELDPILL